MPTIYIIVLQYNHSDKTIECLESLSKLTYNNYHVVVIDNGSDVRHASTAKLFVENAHNKKVTFLQSDTNLGYGAGNNIGIRHALEHGADYVLILNNDTTVAPDVLEKLIAAAQSNPNIGLVQATLVEEGQKRYGGGPITWFDPYVPHTTHKPTSNIMDKKHYANGAALLITKEVLQKVGELPEQYFHYYEDITYSYRVRQQRYAIAVATDAIVTHMRDTTGSSIGTDQTYYGHRNMLLFYKRFAPWYIRFAIPLWVLYTKIKQRIKVIIGRSPEVSVMILRALDDYQKGITGKFT